MKLLLVVAAALLGVVASAQIEIQVEEVSYTDPYDGDYPLLGYVSIPDETPAPAVVIIPDISSVDDYEKTRATMLNKDLGYVGFAADIFGPDFVDANSSVWREQAGLYRGNNSLFFGRIQAAVDVMMQHPDVIADKVAVIGYCFGGTGILTYSFLGATDVVGAVSFHGGLTDFPVDQTINHPVLVLSGGADDTGTEVDTLENSLNAANATWQITRYSGIEHAFTNWNDTRGRYSERADSRSWQEMATFLGEAFGSFEYGTNPPNSTDVAAVDYDDNGFELTGYLSIPPGAEMDKTPAVVIVPDWDGVSGPDGYEAERATLLAQAGYVGFAADIYGADKQQVESFDERVELTTLYRTNYTLFVSRIQAAVDLVAAHELVDPESVFLIGYCFGGTGVVDYSFAADVTKVKVVVPFHGGLTGLAPIETDVVYPYVLVQSGGEDDAHGNNTELEMMLDAANATWEISRYSNVYHGFTHWGGGAYNPLADWRSWDAMMGVFEMVTKSDHDDYEDDGHGHSHDHGDEDDHGEEEMEGEESTNGADDAESTNGATSACWSQHQGFAGLVLLSMISFLL
ncbi:dienelactone hydrolase [Seminavis robusta]|uniref:Dienelactone hydrolase n=1 Tax=Seminavis robusta TaxID=568900 RepID=A0A9N8EIN0_9STRA|nr:dienelactone hydrolase [Seminavis robusta]|eukprot:Sro1162_g247900.1 dienelactone hydrolase (571) ;mRNA; f:17270-19267